MNNKESYEKGIDVLKKLTDEHGISMIQSYKEISPEFTEMMISFGFGTVYTTGSLELKQRTMLTMASLVSQGAFEQLPFHIRAAINLGISPQEIVEVILHCAAYAGFPKAASGMRIARDLFQELGVELPGESS